MNTPPLHVSQRVVVDSGNALPSEVGAPVSAAKAEEEGARSPQDTRSEPELPNWRVEILGANQTVGVNTIEPSEQLSAALSADRDCA